MAYLQKQNEEQGKQQQIAIGKHNRESLLQDPHNDNVLYALAHKKPNHKDSYVGDIIEEDNEDSQDKEVKKRGPQRANISQQ